MRRRFDEPVTDEDAVLEKIKTGAEPTGHCCEQKPEEKDVPEEAEGHGEDNTRGRDVRLVEVELLEHGDGVVAGDEAEDGIEPGVEFRSQEGEGEEEQIGVGWKEIGRELDDEIIAVQADGSPLLGGQEVMRFLEEEDGEEHVSGLMLEHVKELQPLAEEDPEEAPGEKSPGGELHFRREDEIRSDQVVQAEGVRRRPEGRDNPGQQLQGFPHGRGPK